MTGSAGYPAYQQPEDTASDYAAHAFLIKQLVGRLATIDIVKIVSVTNAGELQPVGSVTVQPLVNQVDGAGNATAHGVVHNVPYFRVQGGTDAIILDPKVGDIGIVAFCRRDISTVKRSKGVSNPGSARQFDWADAVLIATILNGTPQQYIRFSTQGIEVISPTQIAFKAPTLVFDGDQIGFNGNTSGTAAVTMNANIATIGTLTNNAHDVGSTHEHGGIQTGIGFTGVPR